MIEPIQPNLGMIGLVRLERKSWLRDGRPSRATSDPGRLVRPLVPRLCLGTQCPQAPPAFPPTHFPEQEAEPRQQCVPRQSLGTRGEQQHLGVRRLASLFPRRTGRTPSHPLSQPTVISQAKAVASHRTPKRVTAGRCPLVTQCLSPALPVDPSWLLTPRRVGEVRAESSVRARTRTGRLQCSVSPSFLHFTVCSMVNSVLRHCGSRALSGLTCHTRSCHPGRCPELVCCSPFGANSFARRRFARRPGYLSNPSQFRFLGDLLQ